VIEAEPSIELRRPAYDWLREAVAADIECERGRCHHRAAWLIGGELALLAVYGFCLQRLAAVSAQEPATYPKENIAVSSLAWFTAWAVPILGLGFALVMFWLLVASLLNVRNALRHWRRNEGLAASSGQRLPAGLYPPLRGGGWGLLLLPLLFVALWFVAIRTQSAAIETGIENWREIPQDQA
jgi:hypothetical protein